MMHEEGSQLNGGGDNTTIKYVYVSMADVLSCPLQSSSHNQFLLSLSNWKANGSKKSDANVADIMLLMMQQQ